MDSECESTDKSATSLARPNRPELLCDILVWWGEENIYRADIFIGSSAW